MPKSNRAQIRKSAGLTQTKLSRLTSIPQSRISSWENKDTELASHDVVKIAKAIQKHLERAPHFASVDDLVKALAAMRDSR
jgi:transcriptional regulator with XRE-family HTH domain